MLTHTHIARRDLLKMALALPAAPLLAQTAPDIRMEAIGEKLFVITGAGGNIALLEGPDGLLLIDSGIPDAADALEKQVRAGGRPAVTILINTHYHFDHVGSNERLERAGAKTIAHENAANRIKPRPAITYTDSGKLQHGAEKVLYSHMAPAHTDGDTTVVFSRANVFHAGDLFFNRMYPYIDYSAGGSIEGMIASADRLIATIEPKMKVIPGHGPMAVRDDLRPYRDMLAGVNERITKLMKAGKSLEETIAAEPTKEYDAKWGGRMKPADFVRRVYQGKASASK